MPLPNRKTLTIALMLSVTSWVWVPRVTLADVLGNLSTTLSQQATATPPQLSPVVQQVENQVQNTTNATLNQTFGQVSGTVGNLFGANAGILGSVLNPFEQQMQQYLGVAQSFLSSSLNDLLNSVFRGSTNGSAAPATGVGIDATVPVNPGVMGLPDFYKVAQDIGQIAASGTHGEAPVDAQEADRFNVNPVVLTSSLSAERDRTIDKTAAAAVLSDAGQQVMNAERQAADQTLQAIQSKAQDAQSMDVTQNVMKNLTTMVAGQSALESGDYAQTMMIHQQLAANSVVEANASEALDEANRTRHAEAMAGAAGLIRAASEMYIPKG